MCVHTAGDHVCQLPWQAVEAGNHRACTGMATRPPDFICLIETNTCRWERPVTWLNYTRVAHNWQNLHTNRGVEIYKHDQCPYKVVTVAASADGDALLVQVYTQDTNFGILVVHAPHARKVGWKGYAM